MAFMDKLKKGIDVVGKNAKTAGNVAILKKNIESAKLKKGKLEKELGQAVFDLKEKVSDIEELNQFILDIENINTEIAENEVKYEEESNKFGK